MSLLSEQGSKFKRDTAEVKNAVINLNTLRLALQKECNAKMCSISSDHTIMRVSLVVGNFFDHEKSEVMSFGANYINLMQYY